MSGRIEIKSKPDFKKARQRIEGRKVDYSQVVYPENLKAYEGKLFYIKTYGCQGNVRDSETMAGLLSDMGMRPTENPEEASVVIINTCAVRENAEDKVYGELGKYKAIAKKNPEFALILAGCMMQEEEKGEALLRKYSQVSAILGTHNIASLPLLLSEHLEKKTRILDVVSSSGDVIEGLSASRSDPYKAFVDISYGCDKFCTYCIVPYTRGRERSREMEDILKECRELYLDGYQEITLLGQNVNSYGNDLETGDFATLLKEAAKIGIPRIRFLTSHPWNFTDEMIEAIAEEETIMKSIHLPLQSGSTKVLRNMGRRYTKEEYLALAGKIRERIPGVNITTDIIVGFPGEEEEDFQETLEVVEEVGFDGAFTFIYSPREGTPAAKKEQIPDDMKKERFLRLLKVVDKSVEASSAKLVGQEVEVLVDGESKKDSGMLSGYTRENKLIHFEGPSYLRGCLVKVHIKESHTYSLIGELVGDPILYKARYCADLLKRDPAAEEFLRYNDMLRDDLDFRKKVAKLASLKQSMSLATSDNAHSKAKEEYLSLLEAIEEDPRFANREAYKDEVMGLLSEAEAILNG